jgi:23S rRNA (pseudouridine1915-N3)-methyltransferase
VKLFLANVSPVRQRSKFAAAETIAVEFTARAAQYAPCTTQVHDSEGALLTWLERLAARTIPVLLLLDSRGKQLSSEDFAQYLVRLRDSGVQSIVLAVGPANGWSQEARSRADLILSFGLITLPHELARAVLAEQVYRALTILAGHPYHTGH